MTLTSALRKRGFQVILRDLPMSAPSHSRAYPTLDPAKIAIILATDCGSTTTKAVLIERQPDGSYSQTQRGEAPTTVEEPFADVTIGVVNSLTEVGELAGRRFIDDDGRIIRRTSLTESEGCDLYISTSSAGGGLQMVVAGYYTIIDMSLHKQLFISYGKSNARSLSP